MIPSLVSRLVKLGDTPQAIDLLYEELEDLAVAVQYDQVSFELKQILTADLSVSLLIGALTITLPWAKNFKSERTAIALRVRRLALESGEDPKPYLDGLI